MNSQPPVPIRHWPIALALGLLGGLGAALVLPYALALTPPSRPLPMPVGLIALLAGLQNAVLIGLLGWVALRVAHPLGLDAPLVRGWLRCGPARSVSWTTMLVAATTGFLGAGLVVLADLGFAPLLTTPSAAHRGPGVGAGFLASFYGGITEELMLRLIVMSIAAALLAKILPRAPMPAIAWTAIAVAALLFGAGHLPAAAKLAPLDAVSVTRILVLNGMVGVICGWLYWRRGLEMAIVAHFSADIGLHVVLPLLRGPGG